MRDIEVLKNKEHYCYLITNLITNKVYVGVTHKNIDKRFAEHVGVSKCKDATKLCSLQNSIKKYGKENFKIELLESFNDMKTAYVAEKEYIKKYNSYNCGYNESFGGDCGPCNFKRNLQLIENVINDFCNEIKLRDIAIKYNISYNSVFDITRLRISDMFVLSEDLLEKLKIKKENSSKRKKISDSIVLLILNDFVVNKIETKVLKLKYEISSSNLWSILRRETFKHIILSEDLDNRLISIFNESRYWKNKMFTKEDIYQIFDLYLLGKTTYDISDIMNCPRKKISNILNRSSYKNIDISTEILEKVLDIKKHR